MGCIIAESGVVYQNRPMDSVFPLNVGAFIGFNDEYRLFIKNLVIRVSAV